jgi:hypothetical protein
LRVDFEPTEGANIGVILEVWPENLGQEVPLFRVLERALIETLEEAQDVGYLDGRDRPCLDVPSVADHNQNKYRRGFYPITRLIADLWCRIALRDRDKALSLVSDLERSPYLLLRRIFLFAARDETTFTAGKAWEALRVLEDEIFWGHDAQVEIMRLATGRWKEFTAAERDAFEARIRRGPPRKLYGPDTFQDDEHWNSVTDSATYKRLTRLQESGGPISSDSQAALGEIAIRHPTWMPGGGDRDDFGVWHESGWGPRGRPEDLAEVADDALVSEAMRLQRERRLDQGDVWHTLCHADPERAHRGLKSEARSHHWEAAAWRDLLWAAVNKGDPALQFELAESLLDMPEAVLAEVVHPAASWLQIRRDTLKGDPAGEKSFLCVWDRLAGLTYLRDGARVQEATNDVLDTALNHPAGLLAYTLLDHGAEKKRPQNSGYPAELSARLTRAASATGMPGVFARALLMRSLAYIESIDHQWAETYLMPSLALDQPCAVQMWRSFAGGGRLGSARLFNALKDIMLDVFAQPAVTDRDLEGLITQLLNIAIHHRRGEQAEYLLSAAEIKRALSVGPLGLREPAAWYLKQLMSGGAPNEKGVRWRQVVGPIFQEIWPLDARFRSEQISEHLLSVCLECGDAFDDAVNAVMDFVVPFRVFLLEDSFRLEEHHSDVVRGHPKSTLRLANAILDPVLYPVPNDLTEFLRFCLDGDPSVQSEASYKRLYGLRRQQGA